MNSEAVKIVRKSAFFGLIISCLPIAVANADIFAFRDAEGTVHFTNAPTNSHYKRILRERDGRVSSSMAPAEFEGMIQTASDRYGVDPQLVRAVIKVESDFNSRARSHKGAEGLMQLMPETAQLHQVGNVYDPAENINGGVRHLRLLLDRYNGDLPLTLAAYNAGVKAVEKHRGIPPFPETKDYIRRVLSYLNGYRGNGTISIREQIVR